LLGTLCTFNAHSSFKALEFLTLRRISYDSHKLGTCITLSTSSTLGAFFLNRGSSGGFNELGPSFTLGTLITLGTFNMNRGTPEESLLFPGFTFGTLCTLGALFDNRGTSDELNLGSDFTLGTLITLGANRGNRGILDESLHHSGFTLGTLCTLGAFFDNRGASDELGQISYRTFGTRNTLVTLRLLRGHSGTIDTRKPLGTLSTLSALGAVRTAVRGVVSNEIVHSIKVEVSFWLLFECLEVTDNTAEEAIELGVLLDGFDAVAASADNPVEFLNRRLNIAVEKGGLHAEWQVLILNHIIDINAESGGAHDVLKDSILDCLVGDLSDKGSLGGLSDFSVTLKVQFVDLLGGFFDNLLDLLDGIRLFALGRNDDGSLFVGLLKDSLNINLLIFEDIGVLLSLDFDVEFLNGFETGLNLRNDRIDLLGSIMDSRSDIGGVVDENIISTVDNSDCTGSNLIADFGRQIVKDNRFGGDGHSSACRSHKACYAEGIHCMGVVYFIY